MTQPIPAASCRQVYPHLRHMETCSENRTKATNVGIGIEAHINTIPIPIPNVFMRHRVRQWRMRCCFGIRHGDADPACRAGV